MMCSESAAVAKHFNVEDRRRRFDTTSRYGGFAGQTLVKALPNPSVDGFRDAHVKIDRPKDEEGNVLVSELDMELADLQHQTDASGRGTFQLPALLEERCTSKSVRRDQKCPSVVVTTYVLDGVGRLAPTEEQRQAMLAKREARLTLLKPRADALGHRVFCRYQDAPAAELAGRSLLDHRARLSASCGHCCFGRVFEEHCRHTCFAQPDAEGSLDLFVDLGETCLVERVSTQGRFPRVRGVDRESGSRIVFDGSDSLAWVASYELSYRRQSGKEWVSLGVLKGNSDATTEVVHELEKLGNGRCAVHCRHLRFRPIEVHGHPAMRVGVYGDRPTTSRAWHRAVADDLTDSIVQYSVSSMTPEQNCRRVPVGRAVCRFGCARCSKKRGCKIRDGSGSLKKQWMDNLGELGIGRNFVDELAVGDDVQDLEFLETAACGTPGGSHASSAPSAGSPALSSMGDSLVMVEPNDWQLL